MYDFKKTTWLQGDHLEATKLPQLLPDKIQFFTSKNDELIFLLLISQGYNRSRLFWKYAEIAYFGRLKLFPFHGLTRVHFSLFSENNGLLNIYMLK